MTTKKDKAKDDAAEGVLGAVLEVLESPKPSGRAAQTALPDKTILLTAERAFAGAKRDAIVEAFLHVERGKRPRKLPRSEWIAELDQFRAMPR